MRKPKCHKFFVFNTRHWCESHPLRQYHPSRSIIYGQLQQGCTCFVPTAHNANGFPPQMVDRRLVNCAVALSLRLQRNLEPLSSRTRVQQLSTESGQAQFLRMDSLGNSAVMVRVHAIDSSEPHPLFDVYEMSMFAAKSPRLGNLLAVQPWLWCGGLGCLGIA